MKNFPASHVFCKMKYFYNLDELNGLKNKIIMKNNNAELCNVPNFPFQFLINFEPLFMPLLTKAYAEMCLICSSSTQQQRKDDEKCKKGLMCMMRTMWKWRF